LQVHRFTQEFSMSNERSNARRPAIVTDEAQAADEAFNGVRRRPVLALAGAQMVVCSSHTARKHGWQIVGRMFQRRT